jgi:2-polyprenyl-3-methyl-5-hydroxy-6-metoxy-1,4-benzoquinol methylase
MTEQLAASARNTDLRFAFGENWRQFSSQIDAARIAEAQASLERMLGVGSLQGKRFLDVGCGSGLFSLAARRLGAEVLSFDDDEGAVRCAQAVKQKYLRDDSNWQIRSGSVLDTDFMEALGQFDIVYAWGVLHHTGNMWLALQLTAGRVDNGGRLYVALYNDQGLRSRCWWHVKRIYNSLPRIARPFYLGTFAIALEVGALVIAMLHVKPSRLFDRWLKYHNVRGMSRWHDTVDWIGGFPFEVATPEQVVQFCRARAFSVGKLVTCGRKMGCNEFVFERPAEPQSNNSR